MAFEFIPASDPRARFTVDIPVGGKKHTFDVPKMGFIPNAVFTEFSEWITANPEETMVEQGKRPIAELFDTLIGMLKIDNAAKFTEELVYAEKKQLWEEWQHQSNLPLGESSDSAAS
ncbi:hypothetical protein [Corynebacterium lactis]|uniref:Uncharacterized protein n=1 Tax=Corynebacterium lactis RW2-5 TaxID=1408189 RepID=A0A0K2H3C5_9CORY|nr:hypothetical protein [Corynebacterium lactis]ALA68550.1 hypothetical protein CLAC_07295 [Corynebacterium lactis RW2-5]